VLLISHAQTRGSLHKETLLSQKLGSAIRAYFGSGFQPSTHREGAQEIKFGASFILKSNYFVQNKIIEDK
jgi:hypothetical protein